MHLFFVILSILTIVSLVQSECPNWCSNHGYCTSSSNDGFCICENGYTGDDCGTRICPKAFDPLTLEERTFRRTIRLITNLQTGTMYGKLAFSFGQSTVYFNPDANSFTSADCTQALKGLKSADASCIRQESTPTGGGTYLITLNNFPLYPAENNMFSHNGNPPSTAFYCNMSKVNNLEVGNALPPTCDIYDVESPSGELIPGTFILPYSIHCVLLLDYCVVML